MSKVFRTLPLFLVLALLARAAEKSQPQKPVAKPLPSDRLHNLFELSPNLFSGSAPHGDEAFAELAHRGITTIVSVDGSRPDVETAHKYGMTYVHIPIRYDGIEAHSAKAMARVARDVEGPVYIHCHHGKHRGPAATAVIGIACDLFNHDQAEQYLKQAGTSPKYGGLYRDVARFQVPEPGTELPELIEIAQVPNMAANMAQISHAWEELLAVQKNAWKPLKDATYSPLEHAVLIEEGFRESQRDVKREQDKDLLLQLKQSARLARELAKAIDKGSHKQAEQLLDHLAESCARCHVDFRN